MEKYYDPIILDLDGNGVGRVSKFGVLFVMNGGAMFDHNGDGIATATSWVSGADGLLVLDRNGDGVINSGRELFGDSTLLSNGSPPVTAMRHLLNLMAMAMVSLMLTMRFLAV